MYPVAPVIRTSRGCGIRGHAPAYARHASRMRARRLDIAALCATMRPRLRRLASMPALRPRSPPASRDRARQRRARVPEQARPCAERRRGRRVAARAASGVLRQLRLAFVRAHALAARPPAANRCRDLPQAAAIAATFDAHLSREAIAGEVALSRTREHADVRADVRLGVAAQARRGARSRRAMRFRDRGRRTSLRSPTRSSRAISTGCRERRIRCASACTSTRRSASRSRSTTRARPASRRSRRRARRRRSTWYANDRDYPAAWEPSGADFFSPALIEADLMRRVLAADAFASWLAGVPAAARGLHAGVAVPSRDPDRPQRRADRASRRAQPVARMVLRRHRAALPAGRSPACAIAQQCAGCASRSRACRAWRAATTWARTGSRASRRSRSPGP